MTRKKLYDENGNKVKGKLKKPIYKKVWFWVLIVLVIGAVGMGDDEPEKAEVVSESPEVVKSEASEESVESVPESESVEPESESVEPESESVESKASEESSEPEISREYENALNGANGYLDYTSFSKTGLYDQLIYEGYPEDAAQYAVDNVKTDWNENALQAAIDYLDYTSFSNQGLYDQLVYEGYTAEQAQYAIDNLPE